MGNFRIYNQTLDPSLWDEYLKLDPESRVNLLRMAYDFYEKTKFTAPILDVYLMGSIANYNWTPDSDADVHIIIDYTNLQMPEETTQKAIKVAGENWNKEHNVFVKDHKVEINLQNSREQKYHITGIYSLVRDEWIRKPVRQNIQLDKSVIRAKYEGMKKYIESVISSNDREEMKKAKKYLDAFRQYGLDTDGEMSYENIVFKILRARGLVKKLKDSIIMIYDREMSVNERLINESDAEMITVNNKDYNWYNEKTIGPFIIFNIDGEIHYGYSNINTYQLFIDGEKIEQSSERILTHAKLEHEIRKYSNIGDEKLSIGGIEGRTWVINGNVYVSCWEKDVTKSGIPNPFDIIKKVVMEQSGIRDLNKIFFADIKDNFYPINIFSEKNPNNRKIYKKLPKPKERPIHELPPEEKKKALIAIGAKPKIGNIPDFEKRMIGGVDEDFEKSWKAWWMNPNGELFEVYLDNPESGHFDFAKKYLDDRGRTPYDPNGYLLKMGWVRITFNYYQDKYLHFSYDKGKYPNEKLIGLIKSLATDIGAVKIEDDNTDKELGILEKTITQKDISSHHPDPYPIKPDQSPDFARMTLGNIKSIRDKIGREYYYYLKHKEDRPEWLDMEKLLMDFNLFNDEIKARLKYINEPVEEKLQSNIPTENIPYIVVGITGLDGKTISGVSLGSAGHGNLPDFPHDFKTSLWWRYRSKDKTLYLAPWENQSLDNKERVVRHSYPLVVRYLRSKYNISPEHASADSKKYDDLAHRIDEETQNDIKSKYFLVKFGDPRVAKGAGIIFLGDEYFGHTYQFRSGGMKGHEDKDGKWIINRAKLSIEMGLPSINKFFQSPQEVLDFLDDWYEKQKPQNHLEEVIDDKNLFIGYIEPETFKVHGIRSDIIPSGYDKGHSYFDKTQGKKQWNYDTIPWRFRKDLETLYWWRNIPPGPYVDEVEDWIEKNAGGNVKYNVKIISQGVSHFQSHGMLDEFGGGGGQGYGIPEKDPLHIPGERWRIRWGARKTPKLVGESKETITEIDKNYNFYLGFIRRDDYKILATPVFDKDLSHDNWYLPFHQRWGDSEAIRWRYRKDLNRVYWWKSPTEEEKSQLEYWLEKNLNSKYPEHILIKTNTQSWYDAHTSPDDLLVESKETPIEDLTKEHGVVSRCLLIYQELIKRLKTEKEMSYKLLGDTASVIREYVEEHHEKNEERVIFPIFKDDKKINKIIRILCEQHKAGRKITSKILELSKKSISDYTKYLLINECQKFVRMYEPHKAWEDSLVFPAVRKKLSDNEIENLNEKMAHGGKTKDILKEVERIEKELNIYKLCRFTPEKDRKTILRELDERSISGITLRDDVKSIVGKFHTELSKMVDNYQDYKRWMWMPSRPNIIFWWESPTLYEKEQTAEYLKSKYGLDIMDQGYGGSVLENELLLESPKNP